MRFALSVFLSCLNLFLAYGQNKHDYVWVLGYGPNKPELFFGGVMLDFNYNHSMPEYFNVNYDIDVPGILSSPGGQLRLYTNGCSIIGSNHLAISNGDTISGGYVWDNYCGDGLGYPGTQNNLILPFPDDSSRAVVFYKFTTEDYLNNLLFSANVKFTESYPYGQVVTKDILLVNPGSSALITATRHANGRDWWLILPENATNRFFIMLLDPSGVSVVDTQAVGHPWEEREWASQAVFTPDGSKYIRFNPWKGLDIFDFDRCTGQLSSPRESGPFSDPVIVGGGAGVSVDSRYLYVSNIINLYQYDLADPDILSSRVLIDTFDGYTNPFPTTFFQMTLAPDGKLYMFSTNGVKSLHVIHHPERRGKDCGFEQHGMELPAYVKIGSPNIPYFRSGPIDGSMCDTLGINNSPIADFRYEIDSVTPYLVRFKDLSYFLPETWQWDFGGGVFADEQNPPEQNFNGPGSYPVCLTVSNPFGSHTFCRTVILGDTMTSVTPGHPLPALRIYPNPAKESLYLEVPSGQVNGHLQFYSTTGRIVLACDMKAAMDPLDVSAWPCGVYFYTLQTDGVTTHAGKMMKY